MRNDYEVRGDTTAIFLRRNNGVVLECLIDTKDLPIADQFATRRWCAFKPNKKTGYRSTFYCVMVFSKSLGRTWREGPIVAKMVFLHRLIAQAKPGQLVDHWDHNGLNDHESNLRISTYSKNGLNRVGPDTDTTSGFRGVCWDKNRNSWMASVKVNHRNRFLGRYTSKIEASRVVSEYRKSILGCQA